MAITGGAAAVTNNGTNADGSLTSPSITLTAGRQLLIGIAWEMASGTANDRAITSITLSGGGTVTLVGSPTTVLTARNTKLQIAYCANISSSGAQTVAIGAMSGSNSVAATSIVVREVQGGDTGSFFDAAGTGNVGDGNDYILSDSVTTTAANDAVFGVYYFNGGLVGITGNSLTWTNLSLTELFSNKVDAFECLDVGAAGTKTPQVEIDTFAPMAIITAAFKAASAGSTAKPHYYYAQL